MLHLRELKKQQQPTKKVSHMKEDFYILRQKSNRLSKKNIYIYIKSTSGINKL